MSRRWMSASVAPMAPEMSWSGWNAAHHDCLSQSESALMISSSRRLWSMGVVTAEVASRSGGSSTAQVSRSIGGGDLAATPASRRR